jgi:transcriptional regulator with XRE-family HTH domain
MSEHGTRTRYVAGCRCEPCTVANRVYARQRDRHLARVRYGIEAPREALIDALEAREHLRWLQLQGVGLRAVSDRTGIARSSLQPIANGSQRRVTPAIAQKILATSRLSVRPGARVDAAPTWRLLDDLIVLGYARTSIAQALGMQARSLQVGRRHVLRRTADAVAELHRRWADCGVSWHGTYGGYAKCGCRCIACRAASAEYQRHRRARGVA